MLFASTALAARIERAECRLRADSAAAAEKRRPDSGVFAMPQAGGTVAQPQPGSSLLPGASDLAIPAHEVDGTTFRVLCGFESDALNRVHLSAVKPGPTTCGDLEKSLTTEHSEPSQRGGTGTSLKGQEITWKLPEQTIILACGGVASLGYQTVTLDYMAPAR